MAKLLTALLVATLAYVAAPAAPGAWAGAGRSAVRAGDVVVTRHQQRVGGLPVLGGELLHVDAPGRAADLVLDHMRDVPRVPGKARVGRAAAVAAARRGARVRGRLTAARAALAVRPGARPALVWRVLLSTRSPAAGVEALVDARTGRVLRVRDLLRRATGTARIFDPNPVAARGSAEGLADDDDADSALLTAARVPVALDRLTEGQDCLFGDRVHAQLVTGEACAAGRDFTALTRSDDRFEALMGYFHADRALGYLSELGFAGAVPGRVRIVADADEEANAYFDPNTGEIGLGTGRIDAGEDADVIVHELGHAVQTGQSPTFGETREGGAIGEGFSDYFAAAVSERHGVGAPFVTCLSEWWVVGIQDEVADTCVRRVDRGLTAADVGPGTECNAAVHCAGEAWSGLLWTIRGALGPLVADRLVVQANYGLAAESGFQDASRLLLAADRALNGGAHQGFLGDLLRGRGFLDLERLDDTPPDAAAIGVPGRAEGHVDAVDDPHDVLAVPLVRGRGVSIRLTASAGDLDLRLYRPGTLTLSDTAGVVAGATTPAAGESFGYVPAADGTYYLDVAASSGAASYVVETIVDADGDGRPDGSDNCETSPNPDQQDLDADGAGDACDRFPADAANDADGDGRGADRDNCPSAANAAQADWNRDGRGDACDRAARVGIDRVLVRGRRVTVIGSVRPADLPARAWHVLVERRLCMGSRCRWGRARDVAGRSKPRAGAVSVGVTLAPGRYRLRAVVRHARVDAARSGYRTAAVS